MAFLLCFFGMESSSKLLNRGVLSCNVITSTSSYHHHRIFIPQDIHIILHCLLFLFLNVNLALFFNNHTTLFFFVYFQCSVVILCYEFILLVFYNLYLVICKDGLLSSHIPNFRKSGEETATLFDSFSWLEENRYLSSCLDDSLVLCHGYLCIMD